MKLWIARDLDGGLYIHTEKPELWKTVWQSRDWFAIDDRLYPEVTFENSPMEVELKLIEK